MDLIVSPVALFFALILVLIALFINLKEKIGLQRDIITSVFRAIIQLTIVGYILVYIIHVNQIILTLTMVLIIVFNAAWHAKQRAANIEHKFWNSFIAIGVATAVTLFILVTTRTIKFIPSQVVPISGMIAGYVMVAVGLCYQSLVVGFKNYRQAIMERLALGSSIKQASRVVVKEAIKTGMSPTIDAAKTVGIVSLPGMMSGLIFAGINPTKAIMYQILVTFMLISSTSIGSIICSYLSYPKFFNQDKQLK